MLRRAGEPDLEADMPFRRCVPPSGFRQRAEGRRVWWLKADCEAELRAVIECAASGKGEPLRGGRGPLWRVPFEGNGGAVVRTYRRGGLVRHLTRDLYWDRPPRPFAELRALVEAERRGIPTVEVLGAGVTWAGWGSYRGTLVTREAVDFVDWWRWLQTEPPTTERRAVAAHVADTVRIMHARGVQHADLNLTNVLVRVRDGRPAALLLDFDRARMFASGLTASRRRRNLRRLRRSMSKLDPDGRFFPLAERDEFFGTDIQDDPSPVSTSSTG